MLTGPFPNPNTNMVVTDLASSSKVLMLSVTNPKNDVLVSMQNKDYGSQVTNQPTTSTMNPSTESIPPTVIHELKIKPTKGFIHKLTFNPRARATQNDNIVEYLAQSPSATSMLEVLQNFPSEKNLFCRLLASRDLQDWQEQNL